MTCIWKCVFVFCMIYEMVFQIILVKILQLSAWLYFQRWFPKHIWHMTFICPTFHVASSSNRPTSADGNKSRVPGYSSGINTNFLLLFFESIMFTARIYGICAFVDHGNVVFWIKIVMQKVFCCNISYCCTWLHVCSHIVIVCI